MYVRFSTCRLVNIGDSDRIENSDGDGLRYGCLSVECACGRSRGDIVGAFWYFRRKPTVFVAAILNRGNRMAGKRRSESGCEYGEGKYGNIVLLRQAERRGRRSDGGAESTIEVGERDLKIDDVVGGGRLDDVVLEDGVLYEERERGVRIKYSPRPD